MKFIKYEGADKWKKKFMEIFKSFYADNEDRQEEQDDAISELKTIAEGYVICDDSSHYIMDDSGNAIFPGTHLNLQTEVRSLIEKVKRLESEVAELKGDDS